MSKPELGGRYRLRRPQSLPYRLDTAVAAGRRVGGGRQAKFRASGGNVSPDPAILERRQPAGHLLRSIARNALGQGPIAKSTQWRADR